jgi:hypothetical protein
LAPRKARSAAADKARDASVIDRAGRPINAQATLLGSDFQAARVRDGNAEARIQATIVEWIRTVPPDLIVFHPANGGWRTKAQAARFRWLGVLAGIPDLAIIAREGRVFFIEVKTPGNYLSPAQREIVDRLVAMRVPFAVVNAIDDVRRAFLAWGIDTRETAG